MPSLDGDVLTFDSTQPLGIKWATPSGGGGSSLTATGVKTGSYTAAAGDLVICDTTSAAFTVMLPNAPADKTQVCVKMVAQASGHAVTVGSAGSDVIDTSTYTSATLSCVRQAMLFQYAASSKIWYIIADNASVTSGGLLNISLFPTIGLEIDQCISVIQAETYGSTTTMNLATANWHSLTLTGNTTIALSNVGTNQQFTIMLTQNSSGGHTVTWFPGIKWSGGTVPTLSTAGGAIDLFTFKQIGSASYLGCVAGQAFA
jgi:hypothetical protein